MTVEQDVSQLDVDVTNFEEKFAIYRSEGWSRPADDATPFLGR